MTPKKKKNTQPPTLNGLFKSASKGLNAEFNKIRETMPHHGIAGTETERLLSKFLNNHLPRRFAATGGIAIDTDDNISQQCDTLVYDAENNPVYRSGDFEQILPSDSIAAAIEIKSNLTKDELKDAAQKIASVKKLKRTPVTNRDQQVDFSNFISTTCLGVVFAYKSKTSLKTLAQNLTEINRTVHKSHRIDLIVVLDKGIINYLPQLPGDDRCGGMMLPEASENFKIPPWYIHLCIFEEPEHALHLFFIQLLAFIALFRKRMALPFDSLLKGIATLPQIIQTYWYTSDRDLVEIPEEHVGKKVPPLLTFNVFARRTSQCIGQFYQHKWSDGYVYQVIPPSELALQVLGIIIRIPGQTNHSLVPSINNPVGFTTLLKGFPPSLEVIKQSLSKSPFEIRD